MRLSERASAARPEPETPAARRERQAAERQELRAGLEDRIEELAAELLPEGSREGQDWRAGGQGGQSIRLTGPKRGTYTDFRQSGKGMGPFDMIATILGLDFKGAIAWSKAWLGFTDMTAEERGKAAQRAEERARHREKNAATVAEEKARRARQIWHGGVPIAGTPAAAWLLSRAINIDLLPRPPGALRYNAEVWCQERQGYFPAMVAGLWHLATGKLVACHRTFLDVDGGMVAKAPINNPRTTVGSWPGAIVPIARGRTDRRWRDLQIGEPVCVAEGVEEALSVAICQPTWRVGAVGYVGNFSRLELPRTSPVTLCVNADEPGSPAYCAVHGGRPTGHTEVQRGAVVDLVDRGHSVRVVPPPPGYEDFNAFLMGS